MANVLAPVVKILESGALERQFVRICNFRVLALKDSALVRVSKIKLVRSSEVTLIDQPSGDFAGNFKDEVRAEVDQHMVTRVAEIGNVPAPFLTNLKCIVFDANDRIFWSKQGTEMREVILGDPTGRWVKCWA